MTRYLLAALVAAFALTPQQSPTDAQVQQLRELRDALTAAVDAAAKPAVVVPVAGATPHTSAALQQALDAAAPGSTIVLDAGARYVGNFVLPARPAGNAPITVTSSARVPAPGVRADAAFENLFAQLVTTNNLPVLYATSGVHGWRFVGVTFRAVGGATNDIVRIGYGTEATAALYPTDVEFDRVIIRGDPLLGAKRGILANAHRTTLINSDVRDVFRAGQDTTAFGCFNCGTGYVLRNNHLEAGSEVVIFGGAESVARTVATDVLVEGNELTRPLAWRVGDYQVKNLFELKECLRCVIRGNVLWNHWTAAQPGTAIVITPRDVGKSITDVVFENNVLYSTGSALAISGHDNHVVTPIATSNIRVRNNLFILDAGTYGGDGRLVLLTGAPADITFDHNTVVQLPSTVKYGSLVAAYGGGYPTDATGVLTTGGPVTGLVFTNNVAPNGEYGFIANGSMNGAGFPVYFPGIVMTGNVLAGYTAWKDVYPTGNSYPTIAAWTAMFLDFSAGDYRPGATMPKGLDGKPAGVDFTKLPAFTLTP
jgi:hypothetical protein